MLYCLIKLKEHAVKILRPSLDLETLMVGFEKATSSAFCNVFLEAVIMGCLFHMVKNIYHKIIDIDSDVHNQTDSQH